MYAEERRQQIMRRARDDGRVAVAVLAAAFEVTSETIRRDLDALAARGLLSRVHGGAVPVEKLDLIEAPVPSRDATHAHAKDAIAARAVQLLPARPGLTVLLDGGTTTARVAEQLPDTVALVVTNSVPAAAALAARPGLGVRMLGGTVRPLTLSTVGASAEEEIRRLRVDVAVVGTNGFGAERGFSTPHPDEARIKTAMVGAAREIFVVADSSKWGLEHLVGFAELGGVDTLVTDAGLPAPAVAALSDRGLHVEIARQ